MILDRAIQTHNLTKSEIMELLNSSDDKLFKYADSVREKFKGNEIHLRALIEISNYCRCNCKYCGIRAENKNIVRYRLSVDEILSIAKDVINSGYKTIVLQSGEDLWFTADKLADIISEIKKMSDIAITLSIGERSFEEYKILKNAGADRFLLRIETTDKNLYETMHPNADYTNRVRCLKDLKKLGYEVGTGCLVGLPNQTLESLADDILFFKEIGADMVGIGPFIPHKDTPLKNEDNGSFKLALKVMAITRLLLPDINIPATTAMEVLQKNGRIIALKSGANVVMPNFTLDDCKSKYDIYPGKSEVNYMDLELKFRQIGRTISKTKGFRYENS